MGNLGPRRVKDVFRNFLQADNGNQGIAGSLVPVQDGAGTATPISLSTSAVRIDGDLHVDGTISGVVFDLPNITGNAGTATALQAGGADRIKLDGIATGATANQTNAYLLDRTNHTGSQAISSITALQAALDALAPKATPTFSGVATINANTSPPAALAGVTLHVIAADGNQTRTQFDAYGAPNNILFRRANGTSAAPTTLNDTDIIGSFTGFGHTGSGYTAANRAMIALTAAGTWTDTSNPTRIGLYTCPVDGVISSPNFTVNPDGSATIANGLTVTAGNVGIGGASGGDRLQVTTAADSSTDGLLMKSPSLGWVRLYPSTAAGAYNPLAQTNQTNLLFSSGAVNSGSLLIGAWSDVAAGTTFRADGKVGIGISAPTALFQAGDATNKAGLEPRSDGVAVGGIPSANLARVGGWYATNPIPGSAIHFAAQGGAGQRGALAFLTKETDDDTTQPTVRVVVTQGGNVGVGTTAPDARIDVVGAAGSGVPAVIFRPDNAVGINVTVQRAGDGSGTGSIGTSTNHNLAFHTNNAERLRIDAAGSILPAGLTDAADDAAAAAASVPVGALYRTGSTVKVRVA